MIDERQKEFQESNPSPIFRTTKKQSNRRTLDENPTPPRQRFDPIQQHPRLDKRNRENHKKRNLQKTYQQLMNSSQYTKAENVKSMINYIQYRDRKRKIRQLSVNHSKEKLTVKNAHRQQMQKFHQAWTQMFMKQAVKENNMLQKMKKMRKQDEQQCRHRIARRCQSAKPTINLKKLCQIQDIQRSLRKRGKTVQLRVIRDEKRKIIQECRREQHRNVERIAEQQQRRIAERQTRRYRSFLHRIESSRTDKQRCFRREEHRLKQKYKNILKNLEHEQSYDIYRLQRYH